MLKPKENIHKFLLSTPSRFVGEYASDELLISHAWPDLMSPSGSTSLLTESPIYRTYFVVVLNIENPKEKSIIVPNYHYFGDVVAICMSVLFGKRIDHHGLLETQGQFCLPTSIQPTPIGMINIGPYNHSPRKDLSIELNFEKFHLIEPLLRRNNGDKAMNIFIASGSFYLRALQIIEEQPEIAFVDLVTSGEILSNYFDYKDDELFDENIQKLIEEIHGCHPEPEKAVSQIKNKLFQVRRKYSLTLSNLLNKNFFSQSESSEQLACLSQDKIEQRIKASYDLRSRYVHTGLKFGNWITALYHHGHEIIVGEPIVHDKHYQKLLMLTPTFGGLERIIRYCLLRFVHKHISKIDEMLE